jgi:hypothetical protein
VTTTSEPPDRSCARVQPRQFSATLAAPEPIKGGSLTLKEKLIKIGAKVASHARTVAFQTAGEATPF